MKAIRILYLLITALPFLITSCNQVASEPVINTAEISEITQTTATCGGNIVSDGGTTIMERGVCWSTMPNPTVQMNKTSDGTGTGSFTSDVVYLNPASTYYIRAYATTSDEITYYGNSHVITTLPEANAPNNILNPDLTYGTAKDIDGNEYHIITLGSQTWMAENLRVAKYRNGDVIPNITDNTKWKKADSGAQCAYYNTPDTNSIAKFGLLYNFYAVSDSRNLAPQGWHVASDEEWTALINYLAANMGISKSAAQALAAKPDWRESTIPGAVGCLDPDTYSSLNNSSGFCAVPAGGRFIYGEFNNIADYSGWWTSNGNDKNTAWFRSLNYYSATIGRNTTDKHYGLSVRCVKD